MVYVIYITHMWRINEETYLDLFNLVAGRVIGDEEGKLIVKINPNQFK